MNSSYRFKLSAAAAEIRTHRRRSVLTASGIIIGVASVTLLVGAGGLAKAFVQFQVESILGRPGTVRVEAQSSGASTLLDSSDIDWLNDRMRRNSIDYYSPLLSGRASLPVTQDREIQLTLLGVSERIVGIRRLEINEGRFLKRGDVAFERHVAVLNSEAARLLEGRLESGRLALDDPEAAVAVVGVVRGSINEEPIVYLPWATLAGMIDTDEIVSSIYTFRVGNGSERNRVMAQLGRDFSSDAPSRQLGLTVEKGEQRVHEILFAIQLFLGTVAAVALVVGGVGLANVMFMSVQARRREIAIRRSFGATSQDIKKLFILEAISLTLVGGLLGVWIGSVTLSTGTGILSALREGLDLGVSTSWSVIGLGMTLAGLTGFLAGYFPALRASRTPVVDGLRDQV